MIPASCGQHRPWMPGVSMRNDAEVRDEVTPKTDLRTRLYLGASLPGAADRKGPDGALDARGKVS